MRVAYCVRKELERLLCQKFSRTGLSALQWIHIRAPCNFRLSAGLIEPRKYPINSIEWRGKENGFLRWR